MIPTSDDDDSALLDQFGRPIKRSVVASMRREISPTDALQGRPPFAGHLAARMRPELLGGVIRAADDGSSYEWRILEEEIEELFPHYYAVLAKRRRQVCQLPITCQPADDSADAKRHADFVTDWLKTDCLQTSLFDITDAIGKGASVCEIIWDARPKCVRPARLIFREARFFEISWEDGESIWLRVGTGFEDLAPHKFVQHRHKSKSGLTIRGGLTRAVAFLWMYSVFTLRDWSLFAQAYGLPIRVGKYGPGASDTDKRTLWKAVSSVAGDIAAIIPNTMEIEFVKDTDKRAGSDLYERRLNWLNGEVSKLVLGSTAGTEAMPGSHAAGRTHRQAEQDVERYDAGLLSATLTRQLVAQMIAFTFGPQERYPTLQIGQPDQVPLQEFFPGVAAMIDRGLAVKAQEVRERFGLTAPEAGDEVLSPQTDAANGEKPLAGGRGDPTSDMQARRILGGALGKLLTRQSEQSPELVEALTDTLASRAAGALAGMTDSVRAEFDAATDLHDLAHRLATLDLHADAFARVMAQGMALAHLVGQAELIEEAGLGRR